MENPIKVDEGWWGEFSRWGLQELVVWFFVHAGNFASETPVNTP